MPVKVSVIVPVYNPGPYIEECVSSLLRQTLPPDEYEVIFVDDGSTDDTPGRLDELAAEHLRVTVVHQENSGWAGKPRNVGIEASHGEYVMFVDNDDHLGDEALERMYDYGVANGADVVVGKMAGQGRGVPVELFRRNHPRATVESAPLIDSLTPHKMFRRAFLDRIGLRFPEGRRRLEDHVFVTEAFLRADNVSVLSDYVCYYHVRRDDAANAGFQRFDPVGYFKNLREALDVVERYTEPGPVRDRLFRRWLRVEMVERMRGKRLLAMPADYRKELFREMHSVVVERFGPGVASGLQPTQQVVAALIAADRYDDVEAFAEWEAGVVLKAVPEGLEWEDGVLRVSFAAEYHSGGAPLTFSAAGGGDPLKAPPKDVTEAIAWVGADTVSRFGSATADLLLRQRASSAQYFQPAQFTRETVPTEERGRFRLVLRATASVDPARAAGGAAPAGGLWDTVVRVKLGGWTKECRLAPAPRTERPTAYAGVVAGRVVLPYWTARHNSLALDVDRATRSLGLGRITPEEVTVTHDRLGAPLPLYVPDETDVLLRLTAKGKELDAAATLSPAPPGASGALLTAALPALVMGGTTWRTALGPVPDGPEPRLLALPFALRAGAHGVQVRRTPRPGVLRRTVRKVKALFRAPRR